MTPIGSRRLIAIAGLFAILLTGATGCVAFMGYLGGPADRLLPATGTAPPAQRGIGIVFFSGDSGINMGMGPKIVTALAAHGVPVLAVNSLTMFRIRHTPAQAQAEVADAVRRALMLPGVDRVVLIGQSFGADMVQYAAADMPADLRPRIVQVLLAVPGDTVSFKATPGGFFDGPPDGPALPSARRIDRVPLLCVHGAEEEDSLCPLLHGGNVRTLTLPGDHYLHHDAAALAGALWQAIVAGR